MIASMRRGLTSIILVIISTGCEPAAAPPHPSTLEAVRSLDIGGMDDGSYSWVNVTGIALSEGLIYVLDQGGHRVVSLDVNGNVVAEFGGRGEGPGEFLTPFFIGVRGETVWVSDPRLERITEFSPVGVVLGTRTLSAQYVGATPWTYRAGQPLASGDVLASVSVASRLVGEGAQDYPVVLLDGDTEEPRVVAQVETSGPIAMAIPLKNGGHAYGIQRIDTRPIVGLAPEGDWFFVLERPTHPATKDPQQFTIRRFDGTGTPLGTVSVDYVPQPFDKPQLDYLRAEFRSQGQDLIAEDDWMEALWRPDFLPAVSQAVASSEGFWVARELLRDPTVWERYNLNGGLEKRTEIGVGFQALAGGPDFLLGLERDSLDVQHVVRYSVPEGRRP